MSTYLTEKGKIELTRHLNSLTKIIYKKPDYPFKIQGVFGFRTHENYLTIKSEDEVIGRIKGLMFVLELKEFTDEKGRVFKL